VFVDHQVDDIKAAFSDVAQYVRVDLVVVPLVDACAVAEEGVLVLRDKLNAVHHLVVLLLEVQHVDHVFEPPRLDLVAVVDKNLHQTHQDLQLQNQFTQFSADEGHVLHGQPQHDLEEGVQLYLHYLSLSGALLRQQPFFAPHQIDLAELHPGLKRLEGVHAEYHCEVGREHSHPPRIDHLEGGCLELRTYNRLLVYAPTENTVFLNF